jgi:hypothetical protein
MDEMAPGAESSDRAGVLVVRVWAGGPVAEGLRARITSTRDLSSDEEIVTMAVDAETILATVREWLEAFVSG